MKYLLLIMSQLLLSVSAYAVGNIVPNKDWAETSFNNSGAAAAWDLRQNIGISYYDVFESPGIGDFGFEGRNNYKGFALETQIVPQDSEDNFNDSVFYRKSYWVFT